MLEFCKNILHFELEYDIIGEESLATQVFVLSHLARSRAA